jgi:hypothetical protein
MEQLEYGIGRIVPDACDEVLPKIKAALKDEGFDELTEIATDIQTRLERVIDRS